MSTKAYGMCLIVNLSATMMFKNVPTHIALKLMLSGILSGSLCMHKLVEEHTMSDLFCLSLSLHCTHEIDSLTLSMLHHFDKTLSRSKTYHNLSRVENGIQL